MKKLYIAGIDEIPQQTTLEDNDIVHLTIVCPPGYSGNINFSIDILRPGVELDMAGLYFCSRGEKQNFNIKVRHMVGGAVSRQLVKGIVGGMGKCVFNGLIYVAPDAQKTRAFQESHGLVLTEGSVVETHPQLEIYADDVECSHGATCGYLNEDERFYMQSRGIPEEEARRMQILSFLSPVMSRLPKDRQDYLLSRL